MTDKHGATLVGQTIAGKFVIEAVIAVGGIGTVYRARQLGLDRKVALKVLRAEFAQDEEFIERFKREARAASRLEHPNSVRVLDFGQHDGALYLAMEYVEGRTLYQVIQDDFPMSEERTVDIMSQVLAAVGVAHDMGVVHRDLKPENIMIIRGTSDEGDHAELVKVLDFGIASLGMVARGAAGGELEGPRMTKRGLLVGTPEYMAPEQAAGERADRRSDIYSLGVVLYQMLSKRLPFLGDSALTIAVKQMTEPPALPSQFRPVNPKLEAVCLRALNKLPEERFGSAREMRSALRMAINLTPGRRSSPQSAFPAVDGPTGSLVGAIADEPRRHRTPVVVGLTLAVLFATALGVRAMVRGRRVAVAPATPAATVAMLPAAGTAGAATPGAADPGPAAVAPGGTALVAAGGGGTGAEGPGESPAPQREDESQTARAATARRSKAAMARDSRERAKRTIAAARAAAHAAGTTSARGAKGARGAASAADGRGASGPAAQTTGSGKDGRPSATPAAASSVLKTPAPAPAPAPLDLGRARVSIAAISSTTAIPSANIRAALSRAPLDGCYRDALRAVGAPANGTAILHLKIDISGYITGTTLEGAHFLPGVKACVEKAARGARIRDVDTGDAIADVTLNFASTP